jgi:hypothetical protein
MKPKPVQQVLTHWANFLFSKDRSYMAEVAACKKVVMKKYYY